VELPTDIDSSSLGCRLNSGDNGPVTRYGAQRGMDLVGTLRAYFAAGRSPARAAAALHVHPNTVQQRLDRITALLGEGWQQPERARDVQVALRLRATLS
jgi:DNA-binding PucR family transcriptional regulator